MTPPKKPVAPPDHGDWEWAKAINLNGWRVEAHVVIQAGVPVLRSLSIEPVDELPAGGLSGRVLRSVQTGEISRAAAEDFKRSVGLFDITTGFDPAEAARRPGRGGHPIEHYLEVAQVYAQATEHPTRAVKERFGVSIGTATQMIHDARRKHGLLTDPPRRGVAGGRLTDKAIALLKAQEG